MGQILLKSQNTGFTSVSNIFIDEYLSATNEAQIKIYLYLLRCISNNVPVSVSDIADKFNYIEKDVIRSLGHLAKLKLLSIDYDSEGNLACICINDFPADTVSQDTAIPSVTASGASSDSQAAEVNAEASTTPFFSLERMNEFQNREDIKTLIYMSEQLMARPLGLSDITTLLYIHESLHFSVDLMEYLIEYCVNNDHRSMKYIEKVALSWSMDNITTVDEARLQSVSGNYRAECYSVLKALGVTGRSIVASDIEFVTKWIEEYGFNLDMILAACRKTILAISSPSMGYTDSILRRWKEEGISTQSQIESSDKTFKAGKASSKAAKASIPGNRFKNFNERKDDFNAIADELMKKQIPLSK